MSRRPRLTAVQQHPELGEHRNAINVINSVIFYNSSSYNCTTGHSSYITMNVYHDESTDGHPGACGQISADHLYDFSNLGVAFIHIGLLKWGVKIYISYIKL